MLEQFHSHYIVCLMCADMGKSKKTPAVKQKRAQKKSKAPKIDNGPSAAGESFLKTWVTPQVPPPATDNSSAMPAAIQRMEEANNIIMSRLTRLEQGASSSTPAHSPQRPQPVLLAIQPAEPGATASNFTASQPGPLPLQQLREDPTFNVQAAQLLASYDAHAWQQLAQGKMPKLKSGKQNNSGISSSPPHLWWPNNGFVCPLSKQVCCLW